MPLSKQAIERLYEKRAEYYDWTANLYYLIGFREWMFRRKTVEALCLGPGDLVVEVGCGTGLNFELLQEAVGGTGKIVGVDMTGAMLEQARRRVKRHGWTNVELVQSDAEEYAFPPELGGMHHRTSHHDGHVHASVERS